MRDEALNVLAYANWMLGKDEAARSALSEAVSSDHTANLQGVGGSSLVVGASADLEDKYLASIELAELAGESSNLEQGVHAVERALRSGRDPYWGCDMATIHLPNSCAQLGASLSNPPRRPSTTRYAGFSQGGRRVA